jgi:hypothetical protein
VKATWLRLADAWQKNCSAICLSAAAQIYARDLKQFAMIQMNMGRKVRRFRESEERLFRVKMASSETDIEHGFLVS